MLRCRVLAVVGRSVRISIGIPMFRDRSGNRLVGLGVRFRKLLDAMFEPDRHHVQHRQNGNADNQ